MGKQRGSRIESAWCPAKLSPALTNGWSPAPETGSSQGLKQTKVARWRLGVLIPRSLEALEETGAFDLAVIICCKQKYIVLPGPSQVATCTATQRTTQMYWPFSQRTTDASTRPTVPRVWPWNTLRHWVPSRIHQLVHSCTTTYRSVHVLFRFFSIFRPVTLFFCLFCIIFLPLQNPFPTLPEWTSVESNSLIFLVTQAFSSGLTAMTKFASGLTQTPLTWNACWPMRELSNFESNGQSNWNVRTA